MLFKRETQYEIRLIKRTEAYPLKKKNHNSNYPWHIYTSPPRASPAAPCGNIRSAAIWDPFFCFSSGIASSVYSGLVETHGDQKLAIVIDLILPNKRALLNLATSISKALQCLLYLQALPITLKILHEAENLNSRPCSHSSLRKSFTRSLGDHLEILWTTPSTKKASKFRAMGILYPNPQRSRARVQAGIVTCASPTLLPLYVSAPISY